MQSTESIDRSLLVRRIVNHSGFNACLYLWHQSASTANWHSIHITGYGPHTEPIKLTLNEAKAIGLPLQCSWGLWFYFSDLVDAILRLIDEDSFDEIEEGTAEGWGAE